MPRKPLYPMDYKDWTIDAFGGFCTIRTYWATHPDGRTFWKFKLGETKATVDAIEQGIATIDDIPSFQRESLYI